MATERFESAFVFTDVDSKSALMKSFGEAFRFDDDFGENWDALGDALVGGIEQTTLVVLLESGLTEEEYDTLYDIVDQVNSTSGHFLELLVIHQPVES